MQGVDKGGNILTRNSVHLPAFLVGQFSISYFFLLCYIRIRLHLVKHLRIKMSEKSLTQRFDDSMSSLSSENRIKNFSQLNIACEVIEHKVCM